MSAVELPQVASARSSSSRGSLNSAGSSASERSRSERNQRSHSIIPSRANLENGSDEDGGEEQESDGNEDGDEYEDGGAEEEEEEEPQESSGGLWDEVESFLNRPSPSLSVLAKPEKKAASGNVLPTLKSDHQRRKSSEPESTRAANRPARSLYQPSSKPSSSSKAIDSKLLQEAFAYAQKVALMDFDDDQQEQANVINGRHHPLGRSNSRSFSTSSSSSLSGKDAGGGSGPSAPRAPSHGVLKKQSSSGVSAKSDETKKKKSATKSSVYGSGVKPVKKKSERRIKEAMQWDPSNAAGAGDGNSEAGGSASRKHMEPQIMQSLVSNFQNGTTLDELRKELAASQQSMALSRQVLHEAAKSFFQPTR